MMRRSKIAVTSIALAALLIAPPAAHALFGFGMPVIDVTAIIQLIKQLAQMQQEYQELVQTYDVIFNRYKLAVKMAEHFGMKSLWEGFQVGTAPNLTVNTFGETANWQTAVTTGAGAYTAWQQATVGLRNDPTLATQIPGQSDALALLATVEVADGANRASAAALGNSRAQQAEMSSSIQQLEGTVLDGSDSTNTEVEQLNLMNAGIVQSLRMQQDTNAVATSALEESIATNKLYRDAAATLFNTYAVANLHKGEGQWGTANSAAYRLP